MTAVSRAARRRVKVRGGHLGPVLCWAVVFADIGTSVYYVPGILRGQFGPGSALFVGIAGTAYWLRRRRQEDAADETEERPADVIAAALDESIYELQARHAQEARKIVPARA